ncbi:hypothetical protein BDV38DRAFT_281929 [Aspergillus pseudotamarii]|uniref:NAD-dependent epimerase/dehydratase domain-containing protein n=1 Tax=Aspergillus pseudotamarii TaxID=132259 RepID=A0A5N6SXJ1_ASPPS|nr:uncharacterized protein BDV38DRAFT_281929 [Aspergillus pseudotamarii]KAE8138627.1 hypothetical protein BDV38DRAFT_281929 [Aspergillus pseudotamarii]
MSSGEHVLLTGANGFREYATTAIVRSQNKANDIIKTHPSWKGKINSAIVSDFTSQRPLNALFEDDIQKDIIEPAVMGSAHHHGGTSPKRFVLLGSAVSVLNSFEDMSREGHPYTEEDWNPVTAKQAIERQDNVLGYNVSKTPAEDAAWKFMKTNKPAFDLAVINSDIITGPMIHPISGPGSINERNHLAIASFIDGTNQKVGDVRFSFYHFVDVRDIATSHVDALTNAVPGDRLIFGLITPQLVVNIIRKHFPENLRTVVTELPLFMEIRSDLDELVSFP